MPSRTKGKRSGKDDESDDGMSGSATIPAGSDDETNGEPKSKVDAFIDALGEKRGATREWGLQGLSETMRNEPSNPEIEERTEEISDGLMGCIKKGNPREAALAAQTMTLLFVFLGESGADLFSDVREGLQLFFVNHRSSIARGRLAEALSYGSFMTGDETTEMLELMVLLLQELSEPRIHKDLALPALSAWGLLASGLSDAVVFTNIRLFIQLLEIFLEHPEVEIRMIAAENASLLYQGCWRFDGEKAAKLLESLQEEDEEDAKASEASEKVGGDSVKKVAKADRTKERQTLKRALRALEDGEGPPTEKIKVKSEMLEVQDWRDRIRLNCFRKCLQGGLQSHLSHNEAIQQIFGLDPNLASGALVERKMQAGEKRFLMSKNSGRLRDREKCITRGRRDKEALCAQADLLD
mmetsp:Transcript_11123/g.17475  ORF Transcript_11123/g.17475 Transcript_11123/m.17475 type:complete len:411 (-) Transcript_11123:289-1521(-)|eukprot:CAMPEP_0184295288 /NCGR_PEP_ID=MMETSP1049-20130417/6181_1 /TAXON_ID=77928 /ORGANISM="Proteomonas sulcata, Strain CCMP704" /LENGTH=410 /DNA_ID=CAMNT_0026603757 /DNA_START=232 /DNA_END=1464 /DNA_ORIENTATION=-